VAKVVICAQRETLSVVAGEGVMDKMISCLVLAALAFGCKTEAEKELDRRDQAIVDNLTKAVRGEVEHESNPPPPPPPPVFFKTATDLAKDTKPIGLVRKEVSAPHMQLPKTATPVEFMEGDPSPYLEFNVSPLVDRSQYSFKRLRRLQMTCHGKTVESLEMCLGEQINILMMHVEALEKENERLHKSTAKFNKAARAIKKN
jgi:hypothetical protein